MASASCRKFTADEIREAFCKVRSFNKNEEIEIDDMEELFKHMNYERTPEQVEQYKKYMVDLLGADIISLKDAIYFITASNDPTALIRAQIVSLDKDKDGFISKSKYQNCVKTLFIHYEELPKLSFESFVHMADTSKDGKVSIEEAVLWFHEKLSK